MRKPLQPRGDQVSSVSWQTLFHVDHEHEDHQFEHPHALSQVQRVFVGHRSMFSVELEHRAAHDNGAGVRVTITSEDSV